MTNQLPPLPLELNQAAQNALTIAGFGWRRFSRAEHKFFVFKGLWNAGEALGYVNFDITPDEIIRRIATWEAGYRDPR